MNAKADARSADLAPIIAEIRAAGITSARGIAKGLMERGIETARCSDTWTVQQVQRVLVRITRSKLMFSD